MARPLPKDLQDTIANAATKAEVRSVAIFAFVAGVLVGGGVVGAVFGKEQGTTMGDIGFAALFLVLLVFWGLSVRKKDTR